MVNAYYLRYETVKYMKKITVGTTCRQIRVLDW